MRLPALTKDKRITLICNIDALFSSMSLQRMSTMKITLILLLALCVKVHANGFVKQKKEISNTTISAPPIIKGVIRDENGNPLAGASVAVKGLGRTTQTNASGEFTLEVPDENSVLVISYVGYESQELLVGQKNDLTIELKGANRLLERY